MKIYPAVDILKGQAVRLRQGRKEEVTVYGLPVEMARRWSEAGAEWLHVVDLDGAFEGSPKNQASVAAIVKAVPGMRVQTGGGMRSMAALESMFEVGVERTVLGTSAVNDPGFVTESLQRWGDRIAVGIDAQDGIARTTGWTTDSKVGAVELARRLEDQGARLVIYTDISRDGVLVGPNIRALEEMLESTTMNVIASGGVSKIEDVRSLSHIGHPRLDGVIIGKALYEGLVRLDDALKAGSHAG